MMWVKIPLISKNLIERVMRHEKKHINTSVYNDISYIRYCICRQWRNIQFNRWNENHKRIGWQRQNGQNKTKSKNDCPIYTGTLQKNIKLKSGILRSQLKDLSKKESSLPPEQLAQLKEHLEYVKPRLTNIKTSLGQLRNEDTLLKQARENDDVLEAIDALKRVSQIQKARIKELKELSERLEQINKLLKSIK